MSPKVAETDLPWEEELRRHIAPARERKGWTQYELAKKASERGLPYYQVTVQRVEEGQRQIRLNEAVVLAGLLGIDLAELVTSGSDRERLRGFMAGSLEQQTRRYGQVVEAAKSLILMQTLAADRLGRVDPESLDEEERQLYDEISYFARVNTPLGAVLTARHQALGKEAAEAGLMPEDLATAPEPVRWWFGVVAAAAAELRRAIAAAADVPGLEELASAERAVGLGAGVSRGVDLEAD